MKKRLSMLLIVCMVCTLFIAPPMGAYAAASGTCGDNLTWEIDDAGTLTISGTGDMENLPPYAYDHLRNHQKEIRKVVIEPGVTSIGTSAFRQCQNLKEVSLPEGITSIGIYAFEYCYALTTINLPQSLTSIGDFAFFACLALSEASIPQGLTSIGCQAFASCTSLKTISLPQGITVIPSELFAGCKSLESVTLPENVTEFGNSVFLGCSSLKSITIPNGATGLYNTFYNCESLEQVTIPASVTTINNDAFYDCTALKSFSVDEANTAYTSVDGHLFTKDKKTLLCYAPGSDTTDYTIPSGVTTLNEGAFLDAATLKKVTVPETVTAIPENAFRDCIALKEIDLPDTIQTIGQSAFSGCESLTSFSVPKDVSVIDAHTFSACPQLKNVVLHDGVTTIGKNAFTSTAIEAITIPKSMQSIDANAFFNTDLVDIYYPLGKAEWDALSLHNTAPYLMGTVVHYHCNEPAKTYAELLDGLQDDFSTYVPQTSGVNENGLVDMALGGAHIAGPWKLMKNGSLLGSAIRANVIEHNGEKRIAISGITTYPSRYRTRINYVTPGPFANLSGIPLKIKFTFEKDSPQNGFGIRFAISSTLSDYYSLWFSGNKDTPYTQNAVWFFSKVSGFSDKTTIASTETFTKCDEGAGSFVSGDVEIVLDGKNISWTVSGKRYDGSAYTSQGSFTDTDSTYVDNGTHLGFYGTYSQENLTYLTNFSLEPLSKTVMFYDENGKRLLTEKVAEGTRLSALVPQKENKTVAGLYYDKNFTQQVQEDTIAKSMLLYVKYADNHITGAHYSLNDIHFTDTAYDATLVLDDSFTPQNATAILALYDSRGVLVGLSQTPIEVKVGEIPLHFDFASVSFASHRIFLWNNTNTITPLIE